MTVPFSMVSSTALPSALHAPALPARIPQPAPAASDASDPLHAKLKTAADGLEGMFMRQLFSAMRAAVPQDNDGLGNAGGTMFTEMLDDALADRAATRMHDGLTQALYRQLSARLTPSGGSTP